IILLQSPHTLFPYTTLFRSCVTCKVNEATAFTPRVAAGFADTNTAYLVGDWTNRDEAIAAELAAHGRAGVPLYLYFPADGSDPRSEEHTSELQSRENLVCRL